MKRKQPEDETTTTTEADPSADDFYVSTMTADLLKALKAVEALEAGKDDAQHDGRQPAKKLRMEKTEQRSTKPAPPLRLPSLLFPRRHELPAMAVVKLVPSIELSEQQQIVRVLTGGQRTPSPFGAAMGDHTVAWQAVVDSLRARLYGMPLDDAATTLAARQVYLDAWMSDPGSGVKKMIGMLRAPVEKNNLKERIDRIRRLEDAAYRVLEEHIPAVQNALRPGGAGTAEAKRSLEKAIGQHLAFLNYLPFATVRTLSKRGSIGSGEGTARALIMAVEAPSAPVAASDGEDTARVDETVTTEEAEDVVGGPGAESDAEEGGSGGGRPAPAEPAPPKAPPTPAEIRAALWKLFSFEAALRGAAVDVALNPGEGAAVTELHKRLEEAFTVLKKAAWDRVPRSGTEPTPLAYDKLESLQKSLNEDRKDIDPSLREYAGALWNTVQWLLNNQSGKLTAKEREQHIQAMTRKRTPAGIAKKEIVARDGSALEDAARVLAHLLHDHQETVATAYPRAVKYSAFLTPGPPPEPPLLIPEVILAPPKVDPAAAAIAMLTKEIDSRETLNPTPERVEALMKAVREEYRKIPSVPEYGEDNGWARDRAAQTPFVVTHTPSNTDRGQPTIAVNGRPPAPRGVSGMGSHTTAWIVEVAEADALASARGDARANVRQAVLDALDSKIMKLDVYLPDAQLVGGQLVSVFDTAVKALDAATVEAAVTEYLKFRNLLPYATVDAGDRGGHGEDLAADRSALFDSQSCRAAADLQQEYLSDEETRPAAVEALIEAADYLTDHPSAGWGQHTEVLTAVVKCTARLRKFAASLAEGPPSRAADIITATRWLEHLRVYAAAECSLMMTNARKRKQTVSSQ